jgi:glycosyltransferase involved in cell wall biosynthesis
VLVLGSTLPTPCREGALIGTGRVPEVAPYFAAADAGLNAITRGSGANVKLFEYLAAKLPIISTAFGVRGTALEAEKDFLLYEPQDLKRAIQRFTARSHQEWSTHAAAVWSRHRRGFDIQALVSDAVAQLPEFQGN